MTDESAAAESSPDVALGENVRRARERLEMTQKDLADALSGLGWDIDATAVTRIEKGTRAVRVNQLYVLAQALETRPAALLRDEVAKTEDRYRWVRENLLSSRRDLVRALNSMGTLQRQIEKPGSKAVFERAGLGAVHDVGVLKYVEQVLVPAVRPQERVHLPARRASEHGAMIQRVADALVADIFDVVHPGPEVISDGEHREEA